MYGDVESLILIKADRLRISKNSQLVATIEIAYMNGFCVLLDLPWRTVL